MTYSMTFLIIIGLSIVLICIELLFRISSDNDLNKRKTSAYSDALRDFNNDLYKRMRKAYSEKDMAIYKIKRRYRARIDKLHKEVAVLRRIVADLHRGNHK